MPDPLSRHPLADEEIARRLDGRLGTHMPNGLFQKLVVIHRNHKTYMSYDNIRKLIKALDREPDTEAEAIDG